MPAKRDDATPGQKVLALYCLLGFSGERHFLPDLAARLECSKQTVMRCVEQIEQGGKAFVETGIEDGRRWYRVPSLPRDRLPALSPEQVRQLLLCRDLITHLLPPTVREGVERCMESAAALTAPACAGKQEGGPAATAAPAASPNPMGGALLKGGINYQPFERHLKTLLDAIPERRVCRVTYASPTYENGPRSFHFVPVRLTAYRETLYLEGLRAPNPADGDKDADCDALRMLAAHRLRDAVATGRFQPDAKLPAETGRVFGFRQEPPFRVQVRFSPSAAAYVRERTWSDGQVLTDSPCGGLTLSFTAASRPEVLAWVLSFGPEAELLEPADLRAEMGKRTGEMETMYG